MPQKTLRSVTTEKPRAGDGLRSQIGKRERDAPITLDLELEPRGPALLGSDSTTWKCWPPSARWEWGDESFH